MKKLLASVLLGVVLSLSAPGGASARADLNPTIRVTTPKPGNTVRLRWRISCDGVTERGWARVQTPWKGRVATPVPDPHSCQFKAWAWNLTGPAEPNVHVSL